VLRPEACRDAQHRARFRQEGRAAARLDHPNIVRVFFCDECEGRPCLVMEFLEGGDLRQRLTGRPQAPATAAALIATLADAVAAAHRAGIVHRDLKPANVLCRPDGTPKVAYFGLAPRRSAATTR
jgi:serine/threonine-protein kinase